MSRLKRFAHSLLAGYVQLGANVIFTFASVPLALRYLSSQEFGLWATASQIAGYVALVDLGFSASAGRILIDYKDSKEPGAYGSTVVTAALVNLTQACFILLLGIGLAYGLGPLLHIPPELRREFFWLILGQSVIMAGLFSTRIVGHLLISNQRFDVTNYGGALGLMINLAVLWVGFACQAGVYSLLLAQMAATILTTTINVMGCWKLGLIPKRSQWAPPTWRRFRELFVFGRDIFVYVVGNQLVNASQTLLVTRLMGLDAAAVWSVSTRAFTLVSQIIQRIFDFSTSALAEMIVRQERERLLQRFREIAVLSVNLAVCAAAMFAVCNRQFTIVWTAGRMGWPFWNDALLAMWIVVTNCVRVHTGLMGQTKVFGFLRYLYLMEGAAFVSLTILLHRYGGITLMLGISLVCSLCCSFPYGLWRTCDYFGIPFRAMLEWHRGTFRMAAAIIPFAVVVWLASLPLAGVRRLAVEATLLGGWTAIMFLRFGLVGSLRNEAFRFAPTWAKPALGWIAGMKAVAS